jgi:protein arginine kinase activator
VKKCQICGKRASIYLTQIINGQATDLALCETCAREKGLFDPQSLTFAEKFFPEAFRKSVDKIVKELIGQAEEAPAATPKSRCADLLTCCPTCGYKLENFRSCGRLGCSDCYNVFASEIRAEAGTEESGEPLPAAEAAPVSPALQRSRLEQKLQAAIEREDYETAATLRDELKKLN